MSIERSPGRIAVPGLPYIVGGGYKGATEELDALVVRAAEMLEAAYGRDIEIRFNSDRRSGGAWIKDSLPGFSNSVAVGLTARLRYRLPMSREAWLDLPSGERERIEMTLPSDLDIATMIKPGVCSNPAILNTADGRGGRYASHNHASLEDGLAWLQANVDPERIPD